MVKSPLISAFVICCNEEKKIRRCLDSVRWCDEIVIIDSGSTDRTLEICREFTSRILERPWPGFVAQKRFGLEQCTSEWVLNIDADEEVSPELAVEIQQKLKDGSPEREGVNGYLIPRVVFFQNRWWRKGGWYPEHRLRLCRRRFTAWGGEDPHEKAIVRGAVRQLKGELYHYTYSDLSGQIRSLNSLSSVAAESLFRKGRKASLFELLLRPLMRFFKFFILKKGYREGMAGFLVAVIEAHFVFVKYAKLWELERTKAASQQEGAAAN